MSGNNDNDSVIASSSGAQVLSPTVTGSKRDNLDIQEKYRKLKKRFFELEEKYKELSTELQKSGERNVRIRQERDQLLERIMELEQQGHGSPGSSTVALPRTLLSARARSSFEENLRNAMEEEEEEDADDILLRSRHTTSPSARRDNEGTSGTRRSTRTSNGTAKPNTSPSGPRTRSKRSEPDDGASPPSAPKRHKSRLSLSTGSVDNTQPTAGVDQQPGGEAMHEDGGAGGPTRSSPQVVEPQDEPESVPSPEAEPSGGDVVMQAQEPQPPTLSDAFSNPALPSTSPEPIATQDMAETTTTAPASAQELPADPPEAQAQAQSPHPAVQPTPINPTPEATTSTSNENAVTANRGAFTQPATSNGSGSHPLSGNPYLSLSTIMVPKPPPNGAPGSTPTTAHPLFMNPYMYYPSPITPVTATPNTPSYPYNPYFYLTGPPMLPGPPPPGMFPPPQNNNAPPPTPTSSTQSRPPQPADQQQQPRVKPKRLKAHTVTSKNYSIPLVPRDKHGKPMLPLNVGIMTVINLGSVCLREHFHTERYIFPVGYEVTRRYLSTINPNIEVVYHCTILDGGDGPKFQIVPSDTPDRPVIAGTATGAWSSIVKQANAIRNRQHSNSVSGPDFFGLGQNTIKHLIQQLPGAEGLRDYVWQNFIEGGPLGGRHAAVIPALPEEYDAALPRGAVYHSPLERQRRLLEQQVSPSPGELPKGLSHYPQHIIAQAAAAGQTVPAQQQLPTQVQQSVQHAQLQHQQALQQMQDARMMFVPMDSQQGQQTQQHAQVQQQQQQFMQQQQMVGQASPPQPQLMQSPTPGPVASGSGLATPVEGIASPPQPASALSGTPSQGPSSDNVPPSLLPHSLNVPTPAMQPQPPQQQPSLIQPQVQQVPQQQQQQQSAMTQQPTPITPSTSAPSLASLMQAYQARPPAA